ncbi:class I SAM-dependent methyltransferase [Saccharothrix yanglingensis]|uniref:Methyltransferase domain-containing protein n=1 Tax=Saccharothrix yanglingensis TaxID=659496 RepID=A0ABU0WZ47_9PSEU|nr:class I SAM-dependent methyltransferase [Saccharothrix yanglingensis]MDQ2585135.1 hypothetical protein [Saccharothrix yanglingensis]
MTDDAREHWDRQADAFDDEPDHGLRDEHVRRAWADLLLPRAADVVDLGCGTGSLSVLLAQAGHRVRGLDLSDRVAAARAKAAAAGVDVGFTRGDAASPRLGAGSCDVVLARHVLWALPDPALWGRPIDDERHLVVSRGRDDR